MTEEELKAAAQAKAKQEAEEAAAAEAKKAEEADKSGESGNGDKKPSDNEAALLKDVMKHKEGRKAAEKELAEIKAKYSDIDVEAYKQMIADKKAASDAAEKAEQEKLLAAGEFEKVKEQIIAAHNESLASKDKEIEDLKAELSAAKGTVNELTVGAGFSSSSFIAEETIFTAAKARILYGDHFDVENGKVVGYDKPRGSEGRAPLVGADGEPVNFDAAMKRIIESDPEKDALLRAKMAPGAQSQPGDGKGVKEQKPQTTRDKLKSGVSDLLKGVDMISGGINLDS